MSVSPEACYSVRPPLDIGMALAAKDVAPSVKQRTVLACMGIVAAAALPFGNRFVCVLFLEIRFIMTIIAYFCFGRSEKFLVLGLMWVMT
jgi:hypothetical protein